MKLSNGPAKGLCFQFSVLSFQFTVFSSKRKGLAPYVVRVGVEAEEAETDTHVVDEWWRDGDRESDAESGVRDGERNDVAVVEEEQAGEESPEQRDGREDGVGQMRRSEEHGCGERGEVRLRWDEDEKAAEEDVLQEDLLDEGPESVAPVA